MTYKEEMEKFRDEVNVNLDKVKSMMGDQPTKDCEKGIILVHNNLNDAQKWITYCIESNDNKIRKEAEAAKIAAATKKVESNEQTKKEE